MPSYEQPDIFTAAEYKKTYKRAPNAKHEKKEESLQVQVCTYIKMQYPDVIFTCDLASGMKLPIWMGAQHKKMRSSRGLPDLFIACSNRSVTAKDYTRYNGLFLELKAEGTRRKDGSIPPAKRKEKRGGIVIEIDHHAEQQEILNRLGQQGYLAAFACGFDEAKKLIDNYLA